MTDIEERIWRFADVFAPDAIDAALAACDEALLAEDIPSEYSPEKYRLYVKEKVLVAVAFRLQKKASELGDERDALSLR
jgi:hypothetical protein